MRAARLSAGLALALLVHLMGTRLFPSLPERLDVFLVVALLNGLEGSSLSALLYGLAAGLIQDSLGNGPIGLHGFADTVVAYGAARLAQRLVIQRAAGVGSVVAFAALVQQAILTAMAFLLLPSPSLPAPPGILVQAVAKALACGVLAMVIYAAEGRWRRLNETRRRGRMGRLRLE
ncbi:MAG TPA: rod shape-determining protein MreD [Thermoanaerobaculia bacterium]|nr:rod shape-determining protein MreD [Thermoanaerobaculia bacterium]